jgi:hypothetical protein
MKTLYLLTLLLAATFLGESTTLLYAQPEPSNHVTGFTVTATSESAIQITWTDATGAVLPEYYLIVGRRLPAGSFAAVADGPEVPDDNDWSDDNFAAIVSHPSSGMLNVTGLQPESQYEFAIYPYQLAGNANYKTSSPPTASDFTFSVEPGGHSTTFTAALSGTVDIVLSFDAASTLPNANGYVIYRRPSNPITLLTLTDGAAPPATMGPATLVTITNNAATSFTDAGLQGGITYHYILIPYNFDGSNASTYNYLTDGNEPQASQATTLNVSLAQLTGGIAPSPLNSSSTNQAILGFSVTTNGPVTFNALQVNASTTPVSKFTNPRIFKSADNTFGGDVSINTGTVAASQLQFSSIGENLTTAGTYFFFVVVDVTATVNASTPAVQPSFTQANITFTSPSVTAQPATITGTNYSFADTTPPAITATNPTDNATGVPVSLTTLQITFNENVIYDGDNSSNNERIRLRSGGSDVEVIDPLNVSVAGNVVTLTLATALNPSTTYAIQIGNSVFKDAENNYFPGITNDTDWNFQTEAPPNITGYSSNPTCMGETINILGTGFGTATPSVTVNGIPVTPSASTSSSITITIPVTSAGVATVVVTNATNGLSDTDNSLTLKDAIAASLPVYANPSTPLVGQNYQISVDNTQVGVSYRLRELPNPFTGVGTVGTGATITFATIFNKSAAGTYQYEVQAQSSGCTSRVYGPLTVTISALSANAGADASICKGESIRLGGNPTAQGGTGFYSISWSASPSDPSLAGQSNVPNPLVAPTHTTTYTVTVDDSSPATPATDMITITVKQPTDTANIHIVLNPDSAAYNVKNTNPVSLSYTLSGGVSGGSGQFSGPGVNSTTNKFYPNAANLGENTINLAYTNTNGCVTNKPRKVKVYNPGLYLPGLNAKYCEDFGTDNMTAQEPPGEFFQDIIYLYRYSTGTFVPVNSGQGIDFNAVTNTISIHTNVLGPSQYIIYLLYRKIDAFSNYYFYASLNFEITPLPNPTINVVPVICVNETNPEIRVNPPGGTLTVNGSTTGLIFTGGKYFLNLSDPSLNLTNETPDFNQLHYSVTDANGCTNATSTPVRIFDIPIPDFDNSSVCHGQAKSFKILPETTIPPGVSLQRYTWDFGNGFTKSYNDINEVFDQLYTTPDVYAVNLTLITTDNCMTQTTKNVTVAPVPQVSFTWENVCQQQATQFTGNTSMPDAEIATIEWHFDDGTVISNTPPRTNPLAYPNTSGTLIAPLHKFNLSDSINAHFFSVRLTVTSHFSCSGIATEQVYKVPNIRVTGTSLNLNHLSHFDGTEVQWVSGGTNSSWALGVPAGTLINQDASGAGKAWVTNLSGPYNVNENSWVHSPCFDLRGLSLPVLSFDRRLLTGSEDGAVLQVNTTGNTQGNTNWQVVGTTGEGLNWYNSSAILGMPGGQLAVGWEGSPPADSTGWRKSIIALDDYLPPLYSPNRKNVRFRFAFGSDAGFAEREGFAFDNFRIDKRGRVVLVEQFTNSGATDTSPTEPNKFSNQQVNAFIGLPKTTNEIVKIQYHVGFPGPSIDRLYMDNPQDASARAAFYGVTTTPYTYMDGIRQSGDFYNPPDPPGFSWAPALFSQLSLESPKLRIDTIFTQNQNTDGIEDSLTVVTRFTAISNLPADVVLHVVAVERQITAVTGANGETNFTYVMKKMLPNALGTRFTYPLPANSAYEVKVHWVPRAYHPDSLSLVVFAQHLRTREVYQAAFLKNLPYLPPNSLVTSIENPFASNLHLYPNPADEVLHIRLPEPTPVAVPVTLSDMQGRPVLYLTVPQGQQSVSMDTRPLASGMYLLQLKAGQHTLHKKVMIVHGR